LLGHEADPDSAIAQQLAYWQQNLADLPEQLSLPTDRPRPATASYRGDSVPVRIDAQLHGKLIGLAREGQASLFMVLQAGLPALLPPPRAGTHIPPRRPVSGAPAQARERLCGVFVTPARLCG